MPLSFDKICRTCMSEHQTLMSINDQCLQHSENDVILGTTPDPDGLRIVDMLVCVTKTKIPKNDQLPKSLCIPCVSDLNHAYSYKQKCKRSEATLKSYLRHKDKVMDDKTIPSICEGTNLVKEGTVYDLENQHTILQCSNCNFFCYDKNVILEHLTNEHVQSPPKELQAEDTMNAEDKIESKVEVGAEENNIYFEVSSGKDFQSDEVEKKPEDKPPIKIVFKCNKCSAGFARQKSLKIHERSNKCTQSEYSCELCNNVFVKKKDLEKHQVTHIMDSATDERDIKNEDGLSEDRRHVCPYCSKSFKMTSSLKDHVRTHNGEKPFLCAICGKGFSQSTNLKQHLMRHSKIKPFKCTECNYDFVSKGELNAHLRKHTGDHPFVCDVCGTGLTTSSSLRKHRRIHTGEKPYACEFCPLRFTALSTLKNHRRTHTGERPFKCKFCDRSFAQKTDMVSHMRTHTGERPYVCRFCSASFQQSSTLKTHVKIHARKLNDFGRSKTKNQENQQGIKSPTVNILSIVSVGSESSHSSNKAALLH